MDGKVGGKVINANGKVVSLHRVPKWDYTADVVVVGYGSAGGNAAIAAHDAGAKVILIDKMSVPGGNSAVCRGAILVPKTVDDAIEYYRGLSFGSADEDMIRAVAEALVGIPAFLKEQGASLKVKEVTPAFPSLLKAGLNRIQFYPTGPGGFEFLAGLVGKRGIPVMLQTPAQGLVQVPETGEVVGVKAQNEGKAIYLKAEKGVVLSCGGYQNNPEMFGDYNIAGISDFVFPRGTPANSGDGLKMAAAAGAYLWHTISIEWGAFCAKAPSKEFGVSVGDHVGRSLKAPSFVFVNKEGKRLTQETKRLNHFKEPLDLLHFDHDSAEYANLPAFMVFDETCRKMGPVASNRAVMVKAEGGVWGYSACHNMHDWSEDNCAEIEKGWILRADTIPALAGRINVDPGGLEETIRKFNRYCRTGKDLEFFRPKDSLRPILTPPYYALELGLALTNTQGGPKRNKYCQVLGPDGKPIPRLYAAGELGSFFGFLYQGGSNYPEAWAFGRIAGQQAASEKPFRLE